MIIYKHNNTIHLFCFIYINIQKMDMDVIGYNFWVVFESNAIGYFDNPTPKQKNRMKTFFENFCIPCSCQDDYDRELKNTPLTDNVLSSRRNLTMWVINMHNTINKKLGKKIFTLNDAISVMSSKYGMNLDFLLVPSPTNTNNIDSKYMTNKNTLIISNNIDSSKKIINEIKTATSMANKPFVPAANKNQKTDFMNSNNLKNEKFIEKSNEKVGVNKSSRQLSVAERLRIRHFEVLLQSQKNEEDKKQQNISARKTDSKTLSKNSTAETKLYNMPSKKQTYESVKDAIRASGIARNNKKMVSVSQAVARGQTRSNMSATQLRSSTVKRRCACSR